MSHFFDIIYAGAGDSDGFTGVQNFFQSMFFCPGGYKGVTFLNMICPSGKMGKFGVRK